MQNPDFKNYITSLAKRSTDEKGPFVIEEMAHINGKENTVFSYYFNYADYHIANNDWENAIKYFDKALKCGLDSGHLYSKMGETYLNVKEYEKAETCLTKALEKRESAYDYNNRGFARFKLGQYETAKKDFQECLKRDPSNADAMGGLGVIFVNSGADHLSTKKYDLAYKDLIKAQDYLFSALKDSTVETDKTGLLNNLEAFFINQHEALTKLGKKEELEALKAFYVKAQKFGFKSKEIETIFK